MLTTADFLDRLQRHLRVESDGKLALQMGWKRQQVSRYRTLKETFSDETCLRVAAALNTPPDYIAACMKAQQARTPEARALWERIAQRIAASVLIALSAMGGTPSEASAANVLHNRNDARFAADNTYYPHTPKRPPKRRKKRPQSIGSALRDITARCFALAL